MSQVEEYVDVHEWVFTPGSFRILINDLRELGYISLVEETFYPTDEGQFEFYISLRKSKKVEPNVPFDQDLRMKLYKFKLQEEINFYSEISTSKSANSGKTPERGKMKNWIQRLVD